MKIVIIDDHPLIRKGLKSAFSLEEEIEVVGEATNSKDALSLLKSCPADIAIVDLRLGEESGLSLIKSAIEQQVNCKFVILTSSTSEADFVKAKEIGVAGYLLKEALPEELLHGLRLIYKGRKYYDPSVFDFMMDAEASVENDNHIELLTPKEKEILIELGKGRSNKDISKTMYISEFTVKKHISQIFSKLDLSDRTEAALYANAKGLVKYVFNPK